jgi:hypothetical protein
MKQEYSNLKKLHCRFHEHLKILTQFPHHKQHQWKQTFQKILFKNACFMLKKMLGKKLIYVFGFFEMTRWHHAHRRHSIKHQNCLGKKVKKFFREKKYLNFTNGFLSKKIKKKVNSCLWSFFWNDIQSKIKIFLVKKMVKSFFSGEKSIQISQKDFWDFYFLIGKSWMKSNRFYLFF